MVPSIITLERANPCHLDLLIDIDTDACSLYAEAGLLVEFPQDHPFVLHEQARWAQSLAQGQVWLGFVGDVPAGFAALGCVDGAPYLDQLSVRRSFMRLGMGTRLLLQTIADTRKQGALWLTTYNHLPWNRPYYEHHGFVVVPEADLGPQIRAHLEEQRACLPVPSQRVAMCSLF